MENSNSKNTINKKSFSRFFATQILYSYCFEEGEEIDIENFTNFMEEYYIAEEFSKEDAEKYKKNMSMSFLNELLTNTIKNMQDIDLFLNNTISGKYSFDTIGKLIQIILRLAVYEFKYTDTDKKIIINEYVDISAEYLDKKVVSFVNATLDNISKNI